jgi:hypothetical protein
MASRTGDPEGNLSRACDALRRLRYPRELFREGARAGEPAAFLPLLHHALLGFSRPLAARLVERGYHLGAASDRRFVEGAFKVLRDEFGYRTSLTPSQFLQRGYAGE